MCCGHEGVRPPWFKVPRGDIVRVERDPWDPQARTRCRVRGTTGTRVRCQDLPLSRRTQWAAGDEDRTSSG